MAKGRRLRKLRTLCIIVIVFGLIACALWQVGQFQASAAPASLDQQQFLATDYRFRALRATDVSEREALFLRMIEVSPDVELAKEAFWALSNLYLDDFDEPKKDKAEAILELFLERYPSSRWTSHVESRLLWLRGETRDMP